MKREKYFWKKLFCFVFLFTVVTGCGSVYAAEHGTAEEKETEDHSGMLEDELEQMEESLLDEFDFRQIDQLSGETELGEKVRFRDLTEMLISGNTKELGERFLEFFSGQVFSVFQKGRKNLARLLLITVAAAFFKIALATWLVCSSFLDSRNNRFCIRRHFLRSHKKLISRIAHKIMRVDKSAINMT